MAKHDYICYETAIKQILFLQDRENKCLKRISARSGQSHQIT